MIEYDPKFPRQTFERQVDIGEVARLFASGDWRRKDSGALNRIPETIVCTAEHQCEIRYRHDSVEALTETGFWLDDNGSVLRVVGPRDMHEQASKSELERGLPRFRTLTHEAVRASFEHVGLKAELVERRRAEQLARNAQRLAGLEREREARRLAAIRARDELIRRLNGQFAGRPLDSIAADRHQLTLVFGGVSLVIACDGYRPTLVINDVVMPGED